MSDKPTFSSGVKAVSDSFQFLLERCNQVQESRERKENEATCYNRLHTGYHESREDCPECREQMEQDQRRLYDLEDRANRS